MSKTIRFKENSLIAIKEKLNEIMVGTDGVSHNDVSGNVKLYHGTTIDALLIIMESGVMSAKRGKQHGETYGVNWFSLKNDDNFNKGALFSIEVPGDVFNERFRMMNNSEAVSKDDDLDVTSFNLTIEKICGLSREAIKNAYNRYIGKGDRYPLESTGYLFDHFIEKVQDDDVLFPSILYHDWDKYYPMIMKNILGNDVVNENKHKKELDDNISSEFAPVGTIGGEEKNGDVVAAGNYLHMAESIDFDNNGMSINDDKILGKYNLKDLILSKTGNYVTLNKIIANELGKGNGSRFMEELTRMADKNGWILALTPDTSFGGSSVGRLKKFYKRFGFVPNKGRSTDFNTRESMIRRPLGENKEGKKIEYKNILTESQESKSIAAAKKLVMQRLGYNEQEADGFVKVKLRHDFPVLSHNSSAGKFIFGITRMFCDGELRNANDKANLNSTLKLVASDAHINEYDRNLNGLSAQELIQRFAKAMSDNLEAVKAEINQMVFDTPSDYEIVRIDSFEQAEEYGDYVSWCVTHDETMFDSYTCNGINQFYFCLKNGFENVDEQPGNGCPLDEYGLSMIAVSVNENGMLNTCTCRWNHDNGGDDSIMDAKQVSQVIGMNFFEVFKPNNKWKELLADTMQRLANGEDPRDVFDGVGNFKEDFAVVELNKKYNFINREGSFISDQWFDDAENFYNGFATVLLSGKCNFINQEGRIVSDQWFDYVENFLNGFARVGLNKKYNFINREGSFISDQWFDDVGDFRNGLAWVLLNGKNNFINQEGRIVSDQWFDEVNSFVNDFARVELNGKYNFINQEGRIVSDQWFDYAGSFCGGFANVELNGKWNFINKDGRIISNQWFDGVEIFREGFAAVRLNGKYNFINQEGRIISDQWFDYAYGFREGFAMVKLNEKYNFINQEGSFLSDQWFDYAEGFNEGFARVKLNGRWLRIDTNGNLTLVESKNKNKKILVSESRLKTIKENLEPEVTSSEVDLSSFKKRDTLPPGIWKDEETLDSRVRLKLLDIADDFWEFVNLTWVEPKGIIITGSICNFNWSKFSDIDLHLIVDFNEIDEKTEFVKQYLDSKKNEWNTEHEGLKIMGFPVELYVQNINDNVEAGGIYDLEENVWIRRPNPHTIKSIGLNKFNIKDKAAEIMTIIDDMYDKLSTTTDGHEIEEIGDDAHYLWDKVKDMRKKSLSKNGESGSGNIVYKVLRRTGYLDKLFKLFSRVYDRSNSISESMKKYLTVLKEEVAIDGSSENNPYEKRWKAEREALKSFVANYGKLMQSKEDNKGGKLYKVYFDKTMSDLIGYNYCICVQWNEQEMKPGSTVYIRALDKFTPFIRRDLQFDTRGRDNMRGTYDDIGY